jgi:hypothetical protein
VKKYSEDHSATVQKIGCRGCLIVMALAVLAFVDLDLREDLVKFCYGRSVVQVFFRRGIETFENRLDVGEAAFGHKSARTLSESWISRE